MKSYIEIKSESGRAHKVPMSIETRETEAEKRAPLAFVLWLCFAFIGAAVFLAISFLLLTTFGCVQRIPS